MGGIFIAPLIFIAALSGFFYALAPTIEEQLYAGQLHADTGTGTPQAQPLDQQVAAARHVYPDLEVSSVRTDDDPERTTQVLFSDETLPSSSYHRAVFVDPGTLEVKGDLVQYGGAGALPFRTWLSNGHRSLWLGDPGRIYAEIAASWLAPIAVTGVAMWWLARRRNNNRRPARGTRRRIASQHSTIGVWVAAGLLFLGASGLSWSLVAGENIASVRESLSWTTPSISTDNGSPVASTAWSRIGEVEHSARNHGLSGLVDITPPEAAGSDWSVAEARQPFKFHNDSVTVDPATAEVSGELLFSSWPLAAQLTSWAIQLHLGTLFGIYSQLALAALALAIMTLVVMGYVMWFKRGRGRTAGRMAAPVAWSEVPVWLRVVAAATLIGYSVIAPLFAASALAIFAIDWIVRRITPRPKKETRTAEPELVPQ